MIFDVNVNVNENVNVDLNVVDVKVVNVNVDMNFVEVNVDVNVVDPYFDLYVVVDLNSVDDDNINSVVVIDDPYYSILLSLTNFLFMVFLNHTMLKVDIEDNYYIYHNIMNMVQMVTYCLNDYCI